MKEIYFIPTATANDIRKAYDAWVFGSLKDLAVKRKSLGWRPTKTKKGNVEVPAKFDYLKHNNAKRTSLKFSRRDEVKTFLRKNSDCIALDVLAWWNEQGKGYVKHVSTIRIDLRALRDEGFLEIVRTAQNEPVRYRVL